MRISKRYRTSARAWLSLLDDAMENLETTSTDRQIVRHSGKPPLRAPEKPPEAEIVLEALDRELDFYRKRAGQVFFLSLLVEVLILAGKEKVEVPETWQSTKPLIHSLLFIAVAAIGIALGREYRSRIRMLKDSRVEILERLGYSAVYPSESDQGLSEIQVLYAALVFLSSGGVIVVWLIQRGAIGIPSAEFIYFFWFFVIAGGFGILSLAVRPFCWLYRAFTSRLAQLRKYTRTQARKILDRTLYRASRP